MKKVVKLQGKILQKEITEKNIKIRGLASTTDKDRHGDIVLADAWKNGLGNYEKNPIILFNHNYDEPCGKAVSWAVTEQGLEVEAVISRANERVATLVEEGILGTFSVGFIPKDLDYIPETDGFVIKEAELLEVSVVSVPANQNATFSLAKAFDTAKEFEEFKKTFKADNSAEKDNNLSNPAEYTTAGSSQEIEMTPEELKQFAKEIATQTATAVAMKQAEKEAEEKAEAARKAAEEKAAAEKAAAERKEKEELVATAVSTGAEELVKDFEARLKEKDAKFEEVMAEFRKELEEKRDEIEKMRNSKRSFDDRAKGGDISQWGKEFLKAKILGLATKKGWDTNYGKQLFEKAGINYTNNAEDIDQEVSRQIEKEIRVNLRVAGLFREIQVNGGATVLPIQSEAEKASWVIADATGNLRNRDKGTAGFDVRQVILNAHRLVSSTFIDDDVDEQVLVNLLPMLIDSVAHAHARAVETAFLLGESTKITGLEGYAFESAETLEIATAGGVEALTSKALLGARTKMGKYGLNPADVAYIVSQNCYYDLLNDTEFANMDEIGDMAIKVTGMVGAVYGSPVIVSDNFEAVDDEAMAAVAVNTRNYVIPRLRGVRLERDREVANQREFIVASQSLGFEQLIAAAGENRPAVKIVYEDE